MTQLMEAYSLNVDHSAYNLRLNLHHKRVFTQARITSDVDAIVLL